MLAFAFQSLEVFIYFSLKSPQKGVDELQTQASHAIGQHVALSMRCSFSEFCSMPILIIKWSFSGRLLPFRHELFKQCEASFAQRNKTGQLSYNNLFANLGWCLPELKQQKIPLYRDLLLIKCLLRNEWGSNFVGTWSKCKRVLKQFAAAY